MIHKGMERISWITFLFFAVMLLPEKGHFQTCDPTVDTTPCKEGQICSKKSTDDEYTCQQTVQCFFSHECFLHGRGHGHGQSFSCYSGFCQPHTCDTTGQCIHGWICSPFTSKCVVRVNQVVAEGTPNFLLQPSKDAGTLYGANYISITWSKTTPEDEIAIYSGGMGPKYKGEYCENSQLCNYSPKALLHINTATLNIKNLSYQDEDFYFYRCVSDGIRFTLHGPKYVIYLTVFAQPDPPSLNGLDNVEIHREVTLTCTVERIRPAVHEIYWFIAGKKLYGNTKNDTLNPLDESLKQISTLSYVFKKHDHGKTVECVVVPEYGEQVSAADSINLGFSPEGKPMLSIDGSTNMDWYDGGKVVLMCQDFKHGKPKVYTYTWKKDGERITYLEESTDETLHFILTFRDTGKYTCSVENVFGSTEESNAIEIVVKPKPKSENEDDSNVLWIVIGVVAFFLVITAILVLYIIKTKLRKNRNHQSSERESHGAVEDPTFQVSEEGDYNTLNYQQMTPDILRIQEGNNTPTTTSSLDPEYIEIIDTVPELRTSNIETGRDSKI